MPTHQPAALACCAAYTSADPYAVPTPLLLSAVPLRLHDAEVTSGHRLLLALVAGVGV